VENPGEERTGRKPLTFEQFYTLVEALKQHKDWFVTERPTTLEACAKLEQLTGLHVSRTTLPRIKAASKVEWAPRYGARQYAYKDAWAILARAVEHLYRELELPPTEGLTTAVAVLTAEEATRGS
jgi:hypothetical protein